MKKLMFLLIALFIIPTCICAAASSTVTKLDATTSNKEIKYNGETTDGVYAVMCKLFNATDEELDLLSSPVSKNKFDGSFTASENGEYKIACANYEGGEFKSVDVDVNVEEKKESNPKTGDNILIYLSIGLVSIISLGGILYYKKRMN